MINPKWMMTDHIIAWYIKILFAFFHVLRLKLKWYTDFILFIIIGITEPFPWIGILWYISAWMYFCCFCFSFCVFITQTYWVLRDLATNKQGSLMMLIITITRLLLNGYQIICDTRAQLVLVVLLCYGIVQYCKKPPVSRWLILMA